MSYVEWLRVRGCLIGVGCTMAFFIVVALVLRIVFAPQINSTDAWIGQMKLHPGATITHATLADGTPRLVIRDVREDTTVTIDGGGSVKRHIVVDTPIRYGQHNENFKFASVSSMTTDNGKREISTIDTGNPTPLGFFFLFGAVVSFIVATCLAFPFAKENDGHLEIAALRPESRWILAVRTVGVDLAGIVLSSLITVVALLIIQAMYGLPRFTVTSATYPIVAISVLAPFAWYAMVAAATSSLKRGYGAVVGFAWPVAIVVLLLGLLPLGDSILGQLLHSVFGTIVWIDPLKYAWLHMDIDHVTGDVIVLGNVWFNIGMEAVLFIIYSALAVFQWQRVEA